VTGEAGGQDRLIAHGVSDETGARPRSTLALVVLSLLALFGILGFTALGIWQLERRVWKLDLIERVEHRVAAAPVEAPGPSAWPAVNANNDEYRRVTVSGHFQNDRETLVRAVTEEGAGFWVLTPLVTEDRFTVLVNRGFVPPDRREPASRAPGLIAGETTVTGLLRISEPKGGFLRANDVSADQWFSRDVEAISSKRGLENPAPYFVDADATANAGGLPIGGLTVVAFHNNHLVYALTWFALALMLSAASVVVVRAELRVRRSVPPFKDLAAPIEPVSWPHSKRPGGTVQSTC
jgi:surfeit locus 1 family protein